MAALKPKAIRHERGPGQPHGVGGLRVGDSTPATPRRSSCSSAGPGGRRPGRLHHQLRPAVQGGRGRAGALGGKAACVQDRTGSNSVAMCASFDDDSSVRSSSPTMYAPRLATRIRRVRPSVEMGPPVASARLRGDAPRPRCLSQRAPVRVPVIRRYSQDMRRFCRVPVSAPAWLAGRRGRRAVIAHLPLVLADRRDQVVRGPVRPRSACGRAAPHPAAPSSPPNQAPCSCVDRVAEHGDPARRPRRHRGDVGPDQERLVRGRPRVQRAQVRMPGPDQPRVRRAVRPAVGAASCSSAAQTLQPGPPPPRASFSHRAGYSHGTASTRPLPEGGPGCGSPCRLSAARRISRVDSVPLRDGKPFLPGRGVAISCRRSAACSCSRPAPAGPRCSCPRRRASAPTTSAPSCSSSSFCHLSMADIQLHTILTVLV